MFQNKNFMENTNEIIQKNSENKNIKGKCVTFGSRICTKLKDRVLE